MKATPSDRPPAIFGQRPAILLGCALLAGLALMLGFAAFDRSRRAQLERFDEPTAVGDAAYFTTLAATLHGQPLHPVSARRYTFRDSQMRRAGRDDATGFSIYTYHGRLPKDDDVAKPGETFFYLKMSREEYVRMRMEGS